MQRHDGRANDQLRPIQVQSGYTTSAAGSVLIRCGNTLVLCTASVEPGVPPWRKPKNETDPILGWVTAEYSMLPGSTRPRKHRERTKTDGRTTEIQRLIGRSLRAVVDFQALGPYTITVDCDVLQADGGTRTTSITGGFMALRQAVQSIPVSSAVLRDSVAAVSVGVVQGTPVLDLDYVEDSSAEVDMNIVMTGSGRLIEVQGTAEGDPFERSTLDLLIDLGQHGIRQLTQLQHP